MNFDENFIKVTEYEVLGKLPNPFLLNDGTYADTPAKWKEHRKDIYKTAVELQYGTIPPKPEYFKVDLLYRGGEGRSNSYRITTGTNKKQVSFLMKVILPKKKGKHPAIVDGDLCFMYSFDKEFISTVTDNNIILVLFDRTELANDVRGEGLRKGALYEVYPEYTFGALGAWAWGYSRCVDALEMLGLADMSCIAFSGHSRGGKTAALAGALDERAVIVNPNATCAGSCGCYRIHMKAITEDGEEKRSETLADLYEKFDFWLNEELGEYADRENELPFDCHYIKALIAPRVLFVSEAASDIWANPIGVWQTNQAAKEVYKLLGAEENLYWYYRTGYHYHDLQDLRMLVSIIKHVYSGEPLCDGFFKTPFKQPDLIFDWRCPEKK